MVRALLRVLTLDSSPKYKIKVYLPDLYSTYLLIITQNQNSLEKII